MKQIKLRRVISLTLLGLVVLLGVKAVEFNNNNQSVRHQIATATADVTRVVDGDTIRVEPHGSPFFDGSTSTVSVRLIGIDAPEIDWEGNTSECFAHSARSFLKNEIDDRRVTLVDDTRQPKYDNYQRRLAYVAVDGVSINKRLINKGFARELSVGDGYDRESEFVSAEDIARSHKRGLWSGCS